MKICGLCLPNFFNTNASGGDQQPIETIVQEEVELRRNLLPNGKPFAWPALTDGPLEGELWTEVVLDGTGKIREMIPPIARIDRLKDGKLGMRFP